MHQARAAKASYSREPIERSGRLTDKARYRSIRLEKQERRETGEQSDRVSAAM